MTKLILETFIFCPYVADRPNFDRLGGSEFLRFLKSESFQGLRVLKSLPEQQGSCIWWFLRNRDQSIVHICRYVLGPWEGSILADFLKNWFFIFLSLYYEVNPKPNGTEEKAWLPFVLMYKPICFKLIKSYVIVLVHATRPFTLIEFF